MKPTSPRNLLKTLRSGGTALLFPGGAREVFKRHLQILAAGYFFCLAYNGFSILVMWIPLCSEYLSEQK